MTKNKVITQYGERGYNYEFEPSNNPEIIALAEKEKQKTAIKNSKKEAKELISSINSSEDTEAINTVLLATIHMTPLECEDVLNKLKEKTGIAKKTLQEQLNMLKSRKKQNKQEIKETKYSAVTLQQLKETVHKWLLITDKDIIDVVLAFGISEKLPGDPLWLFLIAPPGGAKTELLRAMDGAEYYHLSDLTSKTFVSGLMLGQGEERRKIDDLLPQLDKKVLLFKDFTTVLEKNKDERAEIFAQLREIYDGKFSKKFGTIDEKISYNARFGLIAGVTPVIDRYWKVMQQLGERFLKYRWNEDADTVTRQALAMEGREVEMREDIHTATMGFLANIVIDEPTFPSEFDEPLIEAAKTLALLRTPVSIHSGQSDFYYDFIPTPERPTRLVKQLKKLTKALAVIRGRDSVTELDVLTTIKVALSTAPQDRLEVLKAVEKEQHSSMDGCSVVQIRRNVGLPETSIRNILQQLSLLDLIKENKISREKGGFREYVTYYQLTEKIPALSPPTFLEASKEVVGGSTDVFSKSLGKKIDDEPLLTLRFLKDQAAFLRREGESYGAFKVGDVAQIPELVAGILIKKGIAEEVS